MAGKKTILVTGCSDGGLGSALALALHNAGWRVFASARNVSRMTAAKDAGIECVQVDVASDESIAASVEAVKKLTGGSLDAIVNNAGAGYSMPIIDADMSKLNNLFELNVFSLIKVTRAFLPLLLRSDRGAMIANNTSASGILGGGIPFQGLYAASKAAAASLTESLRIELAPFGIRVVNLVTGGVKSGFYDNTPDTKLPADSIYNLAKEAIEPLMAGAQDMEKVEAATWAKQVVADIGQRKPPHLVFRGTKAGTVRLVSLLPTGTADGIMKKLSGIDVLERKIQEKGGPKALKG